MGTDDYINNPIRVDELTRALHRCQPLTGQKYQTWTPAEPPAQSTSTSSDIIDFSAIEELWTALGEDGSDIIVELITLYLDDAPKRLAVLKQAADQEDAELVRRNAHTLKSNSATLGAMKLSTMCKELEAMGRAGTVQKAAATVSLIESEYKKVKTALEEECQKINNVFSDGDCDIISRTQIVQQGHFSAKQKRRSST